MTEKQVNLPVLGLDLHSGSPRSAKPCRYSVVVIRNGKVSLEKRGVHLNEIIKIASELGPCILATDNIFELAPDVSGLRRIFLKLPSGTKIIQVNKEEDSFDKLSNVARREGFTIGKRSDSITEAKIAALLASRGIGSEVILFEPECRILVARNASIKKGGSGTNRWRRMIEAAILNETNRIASCLEEQGIEYDLYVHQAEGGLRRAEFVVYAPESTVIDIVKPRENGSIKVIVTRKMKRRLEFASSRKTSQSRPLLVSIDPGASLGLAISDLEGNILSLQTLRMPSRSQIIEEIVKYGRPVLITTDVFPIPERVKEIAKIFSAKIEAAADLLTLKEKEKVVQEFEELSGLKASTSHERDALAALLITFKRLNTLFKKAEARAREKGVPFTTRVRELLVKGKSISEALEPEEKTKASQQRRVVKKVRRKKSPATSELLRRIRELEDRLSYYEELLHKKDKEIGELLEQISQIREKTNLEIERDRRVAQRDARIRELEQELRKMQWKYELLKAKVKELESVLKEPPTGWIQVLVFNKLSKEVIELASAENKIREGDVLLVIDASGMGKSVVGMISELGVMALIWKRNPPPVDVIYELERNGISVICGRDVEIWWRGGIPYIKEDILVRDSPIPEEIPKKGRFNLEHILREYRRRIVAKEAEEEDR